MSILIEAGPDAGLVWHHGNPVAEQRALEAGDGVLQWGNRGVLTITGPDRLTWLHDLTSQHTLDLAPGQGFVALVLNQQGHVEHVLHGVDDGATVWGWTEPGQVSALASWLDSMRFMTRVEVAERPDLRVVWVGAQVPLDAAVEGAAAATRPSDLAGGRELFLPTDQPAPAGTPIGQWAAEAVRIAQGTPRIFADTDARTIPNEIGLFGTHLNKGCYRGQETVARVHNLGRPPRRLTQLLLDGSVDALPEPGSAIMLDGRSVGVVGSSARHHELGPIALALVKRNVPLEATVVVTSASGEQIAANQEVLVDPEVGLHIRHQLR